METGHSRYCINIMILLFTIILIGTGCERNQSPVGPSRLRGRIVYNAPVNFTSQMFVIFPDDPNNPRRIINSLTEDIVPRWSRDGTRIAFLSDRSGAAGFFRLYVMNDDGSNIRGLFDPLIHPEGDLEYSWAPDGRHIALINRVRGFRNDRRQLHVVNVETLERRLVVPALPNRFVPDWSPAGDRIAFISNSPNSGIATMHIMSYPELVIREIDVGMDNINFPRWSPDGQSLAFVGTPDDTPPQIFVAEGPALAVRQISNIEGGIPAPSPLTWSPDGQRIVFSAPGISRFGQTNRDLFSIHINGMQFTHLTENPADETAPDWTLHE